MPRLCMLILTLSVLITHARGSSAVSGCFGRKKRDLRARLTRGGKVGIQAAVQFWLSLLHHFCESGQRANDTKKHPLALLVWCRTQSRR